MEEHAHHAVGPGMMEIIQLANLLVVILIGYFGTKKMITATVQARSEGISKKLVDSKKDLARVQSELSTAKKDFEKIEDMKNQILAQVKTEGQKMAEGILVDAQNVASRIVADARTAAEDETRVAVRKLREKVVEASIQQSIKTLTDGSQASNEMKVHEKLMARFGDDVKNSGGSKQ